MLLTPHRHVIFPQKTETPVQRKNKPVLFLDRDGVIIKEKHYLSRPDQVELEYYINEFILFFKKRGWLVIVVTNQSGISRGYFGWNQYEDVTDRMIQLLDSDCCPDAIYANSGLDHKSESWRKPSPGMILQAAVDFALTDLSTSVLIGDKVTDLLAGHHAGIHNNILLKTGHGITESIDIVNAFKNMDNGIYPVENNVNDISCLKDNLQIYEDLEEALNNHYPYSNISR